jgi:hypothetical protein
VGRGGSKKIENKPHRLKLPKKKKKMKLFAKREMVLIRFEMRKMDSNFVNTAVCKVNMRVT